MASRGRHGSMNFVAMRRVRRCGLRVAFVAHTQEFRCSAARTPLWATHCLRRIRMPKNFVHLLLQVFQQETLSSSNTDVIFLGSIDIMSEGTRTSIMGSIKRISYLCNAYASCCGLRIVFVASNNTSISFPLQCVRRCGLRTAVLHPTAHHHRCLAMHDFFFCRLTCFL